MFARGCEGSCSVNTRCLPGACLLKAQLPVQLCSQADFQGSDQAMRVMTLSTDRSDGIAGTR